VVVLVLASSRDLFTLYPRTGNRAVELKELSGIAGKRKNSLRMD